MSYEYKIYANDPHKTVESCDDTTDELWVIQLLNKDDGDFKDKGSVMWTKKQIWEACMEKQEKENNNDQD